MKQPKWQLAKIKRCSCGCGSMDQENRLLWVENKQPERLHLQDPDGKENWEEALFTNIKGFKEGLSAMPIKRMELQPVFADAVVLITSEKWFAATNEEILENGSKSNDEA